MGNIKHFLESNTKIKNDIFHYTSIEGLKSIIDNKTLRFTDSQFLNDKEEYLLINEILLQMKDEVKLKKEEEKLLGRVMNNLQQNFSIDHLSVTHIEAGKTLNLNLSNRRFYIFSCSKNMDSLAMWNYYTKSEAYIGYNIGISFSAIKNVVEKIDNITCYYGEVIYEIMEVQELLISKLKEIVEMFKLDPNDEIYSEPLDEATGVFLKYLETIRLFIKRDYFKHEEEFRFVLEVPTYINSKDIQKGFSIKKGVIRPHIDLKFCEDSHKIQFINSITTSPTIDAELSKVGIGLYLKNQKINIDSDKIMNSKIKIRF